jgi:hypothetical protein
MAAIGRNSPNKKWPFYRNHARSIDQVDFEPFAKCTLEIGATFWTRECAIHVGSG